MEKLVVIPTYNERENISKMISKVMSLEGGYHLLVVSGTVRRMISQHLIIRAYIAVKIFIIHILGFFEKTIFGHGAFIR